MAVRGFARLLAHVEEHLDEPIEEPRDEVIAAGGAARARRALLATLPELVAHLVPLERLEQTQMVDRRPTGMTGLDALLAGGWPRGALCEIAGPRSSGRTAIVLAGLARALGAGEAAALIDAAGTGGALDARAAARAGVALRELLWIRCPPDKALAAADLVVAAGGFGMVALDLCDAGCAPGPRRRIPDAAWLRLAHAARNQGTTVLVAAAARALGTFAAAAVDLSRGAPTFLRDGPPLFTAVDVQAARVRDRHKDRHGDRQGERHAPAAGESSCVSLAFTSRS